MVTKGKAQVHIDEGVMHVTCTSLRDVFPLAQHCYNFYTALTVSTPTRPARLVTSVCDRLCTQKKFFGEKEMSKQAICRSCDCSELRSLSRVEGIICPHGFICPERHWGKPNKMPRDFDTEGYGRPEYATHTIPAGSATVRGIINRDNFVFLIGSLPN